MLQVADALAQPFAPGSFDLVWSMESGEHMPDKGCAAWARVLRIVSLSALEYMSGTVVYLRGVLGSKAHMLHSAPCYTARQGTQRAMLHSAPCYTARHVTVGPARQFLGALAALEMAVYVRPRQRGSSKLVQALRGQAALAATAAMCLKMSPPASEAVPVPCLPLSRDQHACAGDSWASWRVCARQAGG